MNDTQLSAQTPYDVIISGAGPVGLFLACELALGQCSVLVLEKAEDPHSPLKRFPFGIRGLSSPSIESLYRRGLLDQLALHKRMSSPHTQLKGQTPQSRPVGHFAGISLFDDKIDVSQWKCRLPGSTPPALMSEMEEVESILARRAARHRGGEDEPVRCRDGGNQRPAHPAGRAGNHHTDHDLFPALRLPTELIK